MGSSDGDCESEREGRERKRLNRNKQTKIITINKKL
jgi:hypothetical protein